jgi:hypothetical protein
MAESSCCALRYGYNCGIFDATQGFRLPMTVICQPHNLRRPASQRPKPYGLRVSLRPGDPFRKIMGAEWHRVHWFATSAERDATLAEMSRKHEYSRAGDKPALMFEKIENLAASRGL